MTLAEAERIAEQSLTNDRLLYVPSWSTCEWCDAEVESWQNNGNGYAQCPECKQVN